jgi:hypothetical protein
MIKCRECGSKFEPVRKTSAFCSRFCCNRWHRRQHYRRHRKRIRRYFKQRRLNRTPEERQRDHQTASERRLRLHLEVIAHLGSKCKVCGFSDWRALQIDHVNGGGSKQLRSGESFVRYYRRVLQTVPGEDFQLLCANHNWIKRYENKEGFGPRILLCPPKPARL